MIQKNAKECNRMKTDENWKRVQKDAIAITYKRFQKAFKDCKMMWKVSKVEKGCKRW